MFWVCSWLSRLTEPRRTKPGTAENLGREDPRGMSRDNRNLLMPRRVRSAEFTGAAGRSAPQFLPDGTELRKRVCSARCYFSRSAARDPAREQFPLALTNFKNSLKSTVHLAIEHLPRSIRGKPWIETQQKEGSYRFLRRAEKRSFPVRSWRS